MINQILNARRALQNKDKVTHKQDLLQTVLGTSDAIPLDNSGHFMLLRKQYYDELLQAIKEGRQVQQELEQRCHLLTLSCVDSNKKLELTTAHLQRFKQNEANFQKHFQLLRQRLKEADQAIIELREQLRIEQNTNNKVETWVNIPFVPKIVSTKTASSQTDYQPIQRQQSSHQEEKQKMPEQKMEDAQKQLYEQLRQKLNHFSATFQQKMNQLQKLEFNIESWQKEKEELRQQNQQLRKKVKTVEAEDIKTKIWSDNIAQLRQKIEQKLKKQQTQQSIDKKGDGWQEAAILRGKLAQFRMQLRKVDQQMLIDEEIEDEGAVVNLVKLTQRIKSIVRSLLVEASLPE